MSLLPWDNWFYHIDDKKRELRLLYQEARHLNGTIKSLINRYNAYLPSLRTVAAQNAALLIIAQVSSYSDLEYQNFLQKVNAFPAPVRGVVPVEVAQVITEATGTGLIAKGIFNIGRLGAEGLLTSAEEIGADTVEGVAEGVAEAGIEAASEVAIEGVTEVVAEGALEMALADTGVGIILAVGVDALLGVFEGEAEAEKLDNEIRDIEQTLVKLKKNYATISAKETELEHLIEKKEITFISLMSDLSKIAPPPFVWPHHPSLTTLSDFIGAQTHALHYYGMLVKLRNTFMAASQRTPNPSKNAVIEHVLMSASSDITQQTLEQYWDVLARHSNSMNQAPDGTSFVNEASPTVVRVPRLKRELLPSDLKASALSSPNTLDSSPDMPVLKWNGLTYWPLSFVDNRLSLAIVVYNDNDLIVHRWDRPGTRYIVDITVNSDQKTVTFIGQSNRTVVMSWDELRSTA